MDLTIDIECWPTSIHHEEERRVRLELKEIFERFLQDCDIASRSPKVRKIYLDALHALGGYCIDGMTNDEIPLDWTARRMLDEALSPAGGPLVYQRYHRNWQDDLDRVCRRLYKYFNPKRKRK